MDPHEAPPSRSVRRARILVVDDDPALRRVMEVLLSGRGWVVETAADGRQALAALTDRIPDLVIMDLVMPGMGGLGALRRLRAEARTRKLPVILMSVISEESSRIKAMEAGADDYLIKPFSGPELLARVATQLDLAEQRRAAAEESESLFRAVADHAPVLISMSGVDGLVNFLNQRTAEFTGRHLQELTGHGWVDVIHPEDRVRTLEAHRVGFQSRRPFEVEARMRRRDGDHRWMVIAGAPRYRADGKFAGLVTAGLDVTDRREGGGGGARGTLAEAEEARAQAETANRTKDEFLATLSHELRTPLNAIVGWVHMLARAASTRPTRARPGDDRPQREVQAQLIADILDVSRIVTGKLRVRCGRWRWRPSWRRPSTPCGWPRRPKASRRRGPRPAGRAGARRPGPPAAGRLEPALERDQVHAGRRARAGRAAPRRPRHAVLIVADNGMGIAPEFLPFVFERFRQADASSTRPHGGLGLGLAIVRHLAEVHGGGISVESQGQGQGAVFTLRLPLVAAGAGASPTPALRPGPPPRTSGPPSTASACCSWTRRRGGRRRAGAPPARSGRVSSRPASRPPRRREAATARRADRALAGAAARRTASSAPCVTSRPSAAASRRPPCSSPRWPPTG